MKKTVLIFAGMMIVGIQVLDAANSTPEANSRSVEERLSSIEQWLGVVGTTMNTHTSQIQRIECEADETSKKVFNLETKMREAEEYRHQQDLLICSLLGNNEQDGPNEKDECLEGSQFTLGEGTMLVTSLLSKCNCELVAQVAAQQKVIDRLKVYITFLPQDRVSEGYGVSGSDEKGEKPSSPSPPSLPSPYIDPNLLSGSSSPRSHMD